MYVSVFFQKINSYEKILIKKKTVGEGQTNIPDILGIDQSTEHSNLDNNLNGNKTEVSDHIDSTTSTNTVIGNQKIDSHSTVDKVVLKNYVPKINNNTKYHSNDLTIKTKKDEKEYIEDEKTSQAYSMEAVAFFDRLKFDDPNIDESEIEYIETSI